MVSLPVRRYAAGVLENLRYQRGLGESGGPEGRPRHQHLTPADSVSSDDCRLSDTDPGASHSGAEIFSPSHTGRRRSTRSSTSSSTSTAQPSTQRRSAGSSASSGRHAASFAIDRHSDSLNRLEIEDWRATISAGSRARSSGSESVTSGNRSSPSRVGRRSRRSPTSSGLRPEEWIALERNDLNRENRLVRVCKRYSGGELKQGTKTVPERFVPLRQRVLDAMAPRIDTRLLFPAPRRGYIDLEKFPHRAWAPALRAAGLVARGPYTSGTRSRRGRSRKGRSHSFSSRRLWGLRSASSRTRITVGLGGRTSGCWPPSMPTT